MTSRPPLALVVLPLLTLLSLAFSMLSELGTSRLVYARVWGGPPLAALSLRVQLIEEESGLVRARGRASVTLEVVSPRATVVRTVHTNMDGWADALLPLPGPDDDLVFEVREVGDSTHPLAHGSLEGVRGAWVSAATRSSGVVPPQADAHLPVTLRFDPPVLSVPFAADVFVELSPTLHTPVEAAVELHGARLLSGAALHLEPGEPVRVRLLPLEHTATITIAASTALGSVRRSVTLPVVAGSLTAERSGDDLTILSPVPRARAYYAVVSPKGRLGGGVVNLGPRSDGTAAGRLARGDLPTGTDRYLTLSSAPDGQAPALVGLPLDGQASTLTARDLLLADGRPAAARLARGRRLRLRWALASYAALGATLSLVLFVWHIRRANERLRLDLAEVGAPVEAQDRSLFGPLGAFFCLLFAFGLALTWILVR